MTQDDGGHWEGDFYIVPRQWCRTMSNMASRFVSRCIAAAREVISNVKGLD